MKTIRPCLASAIMFMCMAVPAAEAGDVVGTAAYGLTNMRAGPGTNYPVRAKVRGGSRVVVDGCDEDLLWCHVAVRGEAGWMVSWRLRFRRHGRWVSLTDFPDHLGVTILSDAMIAARLATEAGPMPDTGRRRPFERRSGSGTVAPGGGTGTIITEPIPVPRPGGSGSGSGTVAPGDGTETIITEPIPVPKPGGSRSGGGTTSPQ